MLKDVFLEKNIFLEYIYYYFNTKNKSNNPVIKYFSGRLKIIISSLK